MLRLTDFHAGDAGDYSVSVSNHLGLATIPSARLSVNFVAVQAALDNGLPWSNEVSSQGWFAQTNETHDGVDGAQNGAITHNQFSWLDSSVVGPGTLTYWCRVSSVGPARFPGKSIGRSEPTVSPPARTRSAGVT